MSLCQALNTYFGIVMTADNRIMTTVGEQNTKHFLQTDTATKIFETPNGYGVSYCGSASIDGVPTQSHIERFIPKLEANMSVQAVACSVAQHLKSLSCPNIIIIASGYYDNESYICSVNTDNPTDVTVRMTFGNESSIGVIYAGRLDATEKYYQNNNFAFDYKSFTLLDATQFLSYINYSTACEMHFSQSVQDVSLNCDVLCITPKGNTWSKGFDHLPR